MRKIFLYFLAAFILTSCDNLKKKDSKSDPDDEEVTTKKKKKPLDEGENTDDEETPKKKKPVTDEDDNPIVVTVTKDNAELRWTSTDRERFMNVCLPEAEKKANSELANAYCSCFLGKVEKKYVSFNEADKKMKETERDNWAAECNREIIK